MGIIFCQTLLCHPLDIPEFLQMLSEGFLVKIHILFFHKNAKADGCEIRYVTGKSSETKTVKKKGTVKR